MWKDNFYFFRGEKSLQTRVSNYHRHVLPVVFLFVCNFQWKDGLYPPSLTCLASDGSDKLSRSCRLVCQNQVGIS